MNTHYSDLNAAYRAAGVATDDSSDVASVRGWLAQAGRIAVLTGAGISAESGVPTFRDAQSGWWAQFDPEELATEAAFRGDPERVWSWYAHRRGLVQGVAPNEAHRAIAQFQKRHPGRLTLITQNVDGLHQRAGSKDVLALHGNLMQDRWLDAPARCCDPNRLQHGTPPRCPVCGNLRRPAVVWFGESLPEEAFDAGQKAALACEVMLVLGTSGAVYPAAGLALTAASGNAKLAIVNTAASELDDIAHALLRGRAGDLVAQLLDF